MSKPLGQPSETVHAAAVEGNRRDNGYRAICSCGWHAGWGTKLDAQKYARRHAEHPNVNPIYPPAGTTYECDK